ncbi:MAG: efflux transporter periplasmic adaptor subunit [Burkholderiales bacterium PBB1]|nr:MAG: efflux transporter periplasmic adaptor subunit [Burkholderiales bacterium PBB1]
MTTESHFPAPAWKRLLPIGVVLIVAVVLGIAILGSKQSSPAGDEHGHGAHADESHHDEKADGADSSEPAKGPHGGRLFTEGGYGLELTIFETGVEPQFRAYTYQDGKPTDPATSQLTVSVQRLGRPPQVFAFAKEGDYLKGNGVVEEPHSFAVTIAATSDGKAHQFSYEQVEARVSMSDIQIKSNGLEVATAGPARIKSTLPLQGEVRLNEDRTVHVVPRLSGLVESVSVNAGDRVRRGQVLAVLSSQSLADQRSDWLGAQKRLGLARTTFEREKSLWEGKISAEQDYLQARVALQEAEIAEQSARQKLASLGAVASSTGNLTRHDIRAPIDGVITDKQISVGEVVKEDANIFVVADLSTVWVDMTVYVKDLNAVKVGQPARVKASSFDAQASGTLSYVGSLVGEQTRAAIARVVLPNPQGLWRPGLPVNVELTAEEVDVPLAISADGVQTLREETVVFGRYGDQFEARPVQLGRSDGRMVEVLGGLEPGERYAAKNSYLIKADIGKAGASHDH